jgi:hypothetical protein
MHLQGITVAFVQLFDLQGLLSYEVRAFENLTYTLDHNANQIFFAPPLFAATGKGAVLEELRELIAPVFTPGGGGGYWRTHSPRSTLGGEMRCAASCLWGLAFILSASHRRCPLRI